MPCAARQMVSIPREDRPGGEMDVKAGRALVCVPSPGSPGKRMLTGFDPCCKSRHCEPLHDRDCLELAEICFSYMAKVVK